MLINFFSIFLLLGGSIPARMLWTELKVPILTINVEVCGDDSAGTPDDETKKVGNMDR